MCLHLEITDFGLYTVEIVGVTQRLQLARCTLCNNYLTANLEEIPANAVKSYIKNRRSKIHTVTMQISLPLYEKITDLQTKLGIPSDLIMENIFSLGVNEYIRSRQTD